MWMVALAQDPLLKPDPQKWKTLGGNTDTCHTELHILCVVPLLQSVHAGIRPISPRVNGYSHKLMHCHLSTTLFIFATNKADCFAQDMWTARQRKQTTLFSFLLINYSRDNAVNYNAVSWQLWTLMKKRHPKEDTKRFIFLCSRVYHWKYMREDRSMPNVRGDRQAGAQKWWWSRSVCLEKEILLLCLTLLAC